MNSLSSDVVSVVEKVSGIVDGAILTQEEHYSRNEFQGEDTPETLQELKDRYGSEEEFRENWECEGESPTHNLYGAEGNTSYRGIGEDTKGKQYIFDKEGDINRTDGNGGSFDFFTPEGPASGKRGQIYILNKLGVNDRL